LVICSLNFASTYHLEVNKLIKRRLQSFIIFLYVSWMNLVKCFTYNIQYTNIVMQEQGSMFWEVIVLVIVRKLV